LVAEHDLRPGLWIAVNRAILRFRVDWFVCLDGETLEGLLENCNGARVCTTMAAAMLYDDEAVTVEHLWEKVPAGTGFSNYSATTAAALAWTLGASDIEIYGADMSGAMDFDGTTPPGCDRSPSRWAIERGVWSNLGAWIRGTGCELRFI
jgi:hypothetical protein